MRYTLIGLVLSLWSLLGYGQAGRENASGKSVSQDTATRQENTLQTHGKIEQAPDLSDPAFIDYLDAEVYTSPDDSMSAKCYLRRNFTDQYLSVWEHPGRIYPASLIFGFRQNGSYYRACRMDAMNSVFGEQIVKGRMSLYYCRKLPQEAGLIEFVSSDPGNQSYRNFMIIQDQNKARYANDFYYFVTLATDSLNPVPVNNFPDFADKFLKDSPGAYREMMKYGTRKTLLQKAMFPALAVTTGIMVMASGSIGKSMLITAPFIAGGLTYSILHKKMGSRRPDPNAMARIIEMYNDKAD